MHDHERSETRAKPQGIGARVQRKEDARHLLGKGNFVADIYMPGLCEVAFLRSPVAHATIGHINIPEQHASSIFTRPMLDALDITADSTLPTYQPSAQPPLAHQKVRFVGEPVVMTYAASRAEAEDLLEEVDFLLIRKEHWETYCFDDAYEGFQCVIYDPTQMSDETRKHREDNQGTCQWCDSTDFFPDSVLCKECAIEPEFDAYPCAECGQDAGPRNEFCSPCRRLHAK
jgi:hypothetical protein